MTTAGDRVKIEGLPEVELDDSGLLMDVPVVHLLPGACETAAAAAKAFFDDLARLYRAARRSRSA